MTRLFVAVVLTTRAVRRPLNLAVGCPQMDGWSPKTRPRTWTGAFRGSESIALVVRGPRQPVTKPLKSVRQVVSVQAKSDGRPGCGEVQAFTVEMNRPEFCGDSAA